MIETPRDQAGPLGAPPAEPTDAVRRSYAALVGSERRFGPDSPQAIDAAAQWADALNDAESYAEAARAWERVALWWERRCGRADERALTYRSWELQARLESDDNEGVVRLGPAVLATCLGRDAQAGRIDPTTVQVRNTLARGYSELGRHHQALALFRDNVAAGARVHGEESAQLWLLRCNYAFELMELGQDEADAVRLLRQARAWLRSHDDPHGLASTVSYHLGAYAEAHDDPAGAVTAFREAASAARREGHAPSIWLFCLERAAQSTPAAAAVEAYRQLADLAREALGERHPQALEYRLELARALWADGQRSAAIAELRALAADADVEGGEAALFGARMHLSAALAATGEPDAAIELARLNVAESPRLFGIGAEECGEAREHEARLLAVVGRHASAARARETWLEELEAVSLVSEEAQRARVALARAYWQADRVGDALSLWRRILRDAEREPGDVRAEAAAARATVVAACHATGRHDEAARVLETQRAQLRLTPGADRWVIAQTDAALGEAWLRAGRADGAVGPLTAAARAYEERFGADDPRTLRRRAAAAVALARDGEVAPALADLGGLLARCRQLWAGLEIHAALALAHAEVDTLCGASEAAVAHADEAVGVLLRWRPPHDPQLIAARSRLAAAALAAGDPATAAAQLDFVCRHGAEPAARRAARLLRRLGRTAPPAQPPPSPLAPDLSPARRDLAYALRDRPADSPLVYEARMTLGHGLLAAGQEAEAEQVFQAAAAPAPGAHDKVSTAELAARNQAAIARERREGFAVGAADFAEILAAAERHLGPDETFTQAVRANLAHSLDRCDDAVGAAWHLGHNLLSLERTDGARGERTLNARRSFAYLMLSQGRPDAALRLGQRLLDDATAVFPPGHLMVLDARNMLAMTYDQAGLAEEARELYEANLVEGEAAQGADADALLPYRMNLAVLYAAADRHDEAATLLRVSLEQADRTLSETDPDHADLRLRCAGLYEAIGDYPAAAREFARAQQVADAAGGPTSPQAYEVARARLALRRRHPDAADPVDLPDERARARDEALQQALSGDLRAATGTAIAAGIPAVLDVVPEAVAARQRLHSDTDPPDLETLTAVAEQLGWGDPGVETALRRATETTAAAALDDLAARIDTATSTDAQALAPAAEWALERLLDRDLRAGRWEGAAATLARRARAVAAHTAPGDPRRVEALGRAAALLVAMDARGPGVALWHQALAQAHLGDDPALVARTEQHLAAAKRAAARLAGAAGQGPITAG